MASWTNKDFMGEGGLFLSLKKFRSEAGSCRGEPYQMENLKKEKIVRTTRLKGFSPRSREGDFT